MASTFSGFYRAFGTCSAANYFHFLLSSACMESMERSAQRLLQATSAEAAAAASVSEFPHEQGPHPRLPAKPASN